MWVACSSGLCWPLEREVTRISTNKGAHCEQAIVREVQRVRILPNFMRNLMQGAKEKGSTPMLPRTTELLEN